MKVRGELVMAGFVVYQDSYIGATIVSNRFIDEYMTDANDAQLKVYLYLVRMLNAHLETSVSDIADRFNHTEKDVIRAFKYWEKKGLLTIDYDENGVLNGVHLVNLCNGEATVPSVEATHKKVRVSKQNKAAEAEYLATSEATSESNVPEIAVSASEVTSATLTQVVQTVPVQEIMTAQETMPAQEIVSARELMPSKEITIVPKPSYSARELQEYSKKQGCTLVSLAEVYFGRPLSQSDLQTLCYFTDGLGMSEDLVDYLLQYCADKGKKDFRYAEKVAIGWKEKNITTVNQAAGSNLRYDKVVYTIMNRLGKSGSPAEKEMEYITRWLGEYGFSESVILDACDRTVLATDSHRFQYAEGILSSWKKSNVRSTDEIAKLDKDYQKKESGKSTANQNSNYVSSNRNGGGNAGSFGKFQQSEIDYEALSKKVFIN